MVFYNEFDTKAARWLRELVKHKLIPDGVVDERSIKDIKPEELVGYTSCHFFAGIGGWPLALRLAGVPDDYPIWTGSCPCQAFSTAGKQLGFKDERDLWPVFFNLIKECRPPVVLGEQVAASIGHGWLDRVYNDLAREDYAVGSAVLGAFSVGAPHKRERLYWGGKLEHTAKLGRERDGVSRESACMPSEGHASGGVAEDNSQRFYREPICVLGRESRQAGDETAGGGTDGGVADSSSSKRNKGELEHAGESSERSSCGGIDGMAHSQSAGLGGRILRAEEQNNGLRPLESSIPILCRDGKTRRIPAEALPVLQCVVDGLPPDLAGCDPRLGFPLEEQGVKNRAVMLKGLGNAIVPQVAAEFIKAFLDTP